MCLVKDIFWQDDISTHALREEGDASYRPLSATACNFYPRPPRGGRRPGRPVLPGQSAFLPTPSARRATNQGLFGRLGFGISTHALREEGDARRRRTR